METTKAVTFIMGPGEHATAAIANGLAAYSPSTIVPITSSFFMFYLATIQRFPQNPYGSVLFGSQA
jgi:transketolase